MFNPLQSRMESLAQQRQMIDQQMQSLQGFQQMPPININNNMPMPGMQSFDFNGKWVQNEAEAKGVANNNLPLILFDQNDPVFYMKNIDGSFKKFKFEEVTQAPPAGYEEKMAALENKLNAVIDVLTRSDTNTQAIPETPAVAPERAVTAKGKGNK